MIRLGALDRKLLRDLWRLRWQSLAVALVIACGISVTVMAFSSHEALQTAKARYYADTAFADVFATATRAPLAVAGRAGEIEGVVAADPRILQAGLMEVPGLVRPAMARVISLPEDDGRALNRVALTRGRLPARSGEAVALEPFLRAAKVELGDRLTVTLRGRRLTYTIVGAVLSPEYIHLPGGGSLLPDDAHQAVLWTTRRSLERAADLDGAFNTLALRLAPGASEERVIAELDRLLAPYGGAPAVGREHQASNAVVQAELDELHTTARVVPPLFLLVAAGLVHMVLGRMVQVEREQIGLLKAFGYRDIEAAGFYARLAAVIGLTGAALGGAAGAVITLLVVDIYAEYFRFPALPPRFDTTVFLAASALSVVVTVGGSLVAVVRAVRLSPAEALQPPRPPAYGSGLLERLALFRRLDQPTRIVLRNLQRYPGRGALTACGLAASLALLVGTQFMFAAIEHIVDHGYFRAQRWTHALAFAEARDARVLGEVGRLPGVYAAEAVRAAPARIFGSGRRETIAVQGVDPAGLLARALDVHGRALTPVGEGLVLSAALAQRLGVAPGDRVVLEFMTRRRSDATLVVAALAEDYSGMAAYIDREALNRLLGEGDVADGANLLVDAVQEDRFYRAAARTPFVAGASSRDDTVALWRDRMTEALRMNLVFQVSFSAAIAFGVAYNIARISLAERGRDLATLRVLGFGPGDCAYILLGEVVLLALLAIPLGVAGGVLMANGLAEAYARDDLRMPAIITPHGLAVCLTAYTAAVLAAAVLVGRRIWRLDLVSVLKTRE